MQIPSENSSKPNVGIGDPARTIADIIEQQARIRGSDAALARRENGEWRQTSWKTFTEDSRAVSAGLIKLGLEPKSVIAISSWTRQEWCVIDLGAQGAGYVVAGIYPTEAPDRIRYLLNDCRASVVVVENQEHYEKINKILSDCESVSHIICLEPVADQNCPVPIISFGDLLELGLGAMRADPDLLEASQSLISPSDVAILIYTSGTTGDPKGAMITHANILHQVSNSPQLYGMQVGWRRPCYLPLCHVAERMFTYFCFASGGVSYFIPDPQNLGALLPEIRPNFILGVPRVYQKLREAAENWLSSLPPDQHRQYRKDLQISHDVSEKMLKGNNVEQLDLDARDSVLKSFRKGVLAKVGLDEVECLASGGVKFSDDLMVWYWSHGVPMFELYGMSETGIISTNHSQMYRLGTTGQPAGLGQVRISADSEVQISGAQVFAGYLNKPDKNAEAFEGRWFRTGDVGFIDGDGCLRIVDRIKDILITGTGKNIAPSAIEELLRQHPLVGDAVLVGEGRNYLAALIVLDPEAVQKHFAEKPAARTLAFGDLAIDPDIIAAINQSVETANRQVSRPEQVRKFRILPRIFLPNDEEVTPTMKLKRNVIYHNYSDLIDEIYGVVDQA